MTAERVFRRKNRPGHDAIDEAAPEAPVAEAPAPVDDAEAQPKVFRRRHVRAERRAPKSAAPVARIAPVDGPDPVDGLPPCEEQPEPPRITHQAALSRAALIALAEDLDDAPDDTASDATAPDHATPHIAPARDAAPRDAAPDDAAHRNDARDDDSAVPLRTARRNRATALAKASTMPPVVAPDPLPAEDPLMLDSDLWEGIAATDVAAQPQADDPVAERHLTTAEDADSDGPPPQTAVDTEMETQAPAMPSPTTQAAPARRMRDDGQRNDLKRARHPVAAKPVEPEPQDSAPAKASAPVPDDAPNPARDFRLVPTTTAPDEDSASGSQPADIAHRAESAPDSAGADATHDTDTVDAVLLLDPLFAAEPTGSAAPAPTPEPARPMVAEDIPGDDLPPLTDPDLDAGNPATPPRPIVADMPVAAPPETPQATGSQSAAPQPEPPADIEASAKEAPAPPQADPWSALSPVIVDARVLDRHRVITATRYDPAHAAFDVLRTRLLQAVVERGWSRIAITSPTKGCGKTFTAANLAISLARQENCPTILFDTDLRSPSLAKTFGISAPGAIGGLFQGKTRPEDHLRRLGANDFHAGPNLAFAFNDAPEAYASELLQDPRTAQSLRDIEERFAPRVMLFDMPPALYGDDVLAMRPLIDAVILVVGGGLTTANEIREVENRLGTETPLLGVVMNRAEGSKARQYGY